MPRAYAPRRGDVVWIFLTPQAGREQAGREQAGRRPGLVVSPTAYNTKIGLAILCPITGQVIGYPFEVPIPEGLPANGVILSHQVKSLDWKASHAEFICKLALPTTLEVLEKVRTLFASGEIS